MPFDQQEFQIEPVRTGDAVLDALTKARALITPPGAWCGLDGHSSHALCVALAVSKAGRDYHDWSVTYAAHGYVKRALPRRGFLSAGLEEIFHFNDTHTQAECLELLDRAADLRQRSWRSRFIRWWRS